MRFPSVALLAAALAAAGCGAPRHAAPALDGLVPDPLPAKPAVMLTDTSGRPFAFAAATRGKLAYLYFGYTHCPNACPATMGDLSYALHHVPPAVRRQVEVVFVTVDPRRDTPPMLRRWLGHYGRWFVGLTGSERQIETAEREAGVPLAPPERQQGASYAVQHASIVLAYSPDGLAHAVYTQGFSGQAYAHDMPLLLAKHG